MPSVIPPGFPLEGQEVGLPVGRAHVHAIEPAAGPDPAVGLVSADDELLLAYEGGADETIGGVARLDMDWPR